MKRPLAVLAVLALVLLLAAAGCGEEHELEVVEGEPIELGELEYNVSISRFLNPADREDEAYLGADVSRLGKNELWFGVFMQIENTGDAPATIPEGLSVVDTQGTEYEPVETESDFALELGSTLAPGGEIPEAETAAASGPIQGAMVLFRIEVASTDLRPLVLEIPSSTGEVGEVELDI